MQDFSVYLWILLAAKIVLVVVFAVILLGGSLRSRKKAALFHARYPFEGFYCVRSQVKQINPDFCVVQMVFANRKDGSLAIKSEGPGRTSDEQN